MIHCFSSTFSGKTYLPCKKKKKKLKKKKNREINVNIATLIGLDILWYIKLFSDGSKMLNIKEQQCRIVKLVYSLFLNCWFRFLLSFWQFMLFFLNFSFLSYPFTALDTFLLAAMAWSMLWYFSFSSFGMAQISLHIIVVYYCLFKRPPLWPWSTHNTFK